MNKLIILIVTSILLIFSGDDCYAYLDPGTGSMLLQGLLAGIMVVGTTIGIYWKRLKKFFTRTDKAEDNSDED